MARKTIYLPDDVMEKIGVSRAREFSSRIQHMVDDYAEIVKEDMPELTVNEWLFLCDMLRFSMVDTGKRRSPDSPTPKEIIEAAGFEFDKKWSVCAADLAEKAYKWPMAVKVAVHDVAFRFWQGYGMGVDYGRLLAKCGARIK